MGTHNNTSPSSNKTAKSEYEQRLAELKLWLKEHQYLLDILLDAYCVVDLNNQIQSFNAAFNELCGETYRKVSKIKDFCQLVHTEHCPANCPAKEALRTRRTVRLDEIRGSSKAFPELQMILGSVPIFSPEREPIGVLVTIRNVTAESVLQKKYDERKKESIVDGLTRVFNKVTAEEYLHRMIKSALRETHPMSVIMCDIDHFKKVNDTYGHQAGDHVLYSMSQILKGETRETDAVGRFGGEEFIVLLAKSDQEGAKIFAERLRKRVESSEILFEGKNIPVTISVGTATFSEEWHPGIELSQCAKTLVTKADSALYFAKAHGRNQTCQYENIVQQQVKKAS